MDFLSAKPEKVTGQLVRATLIKGDHVVQLMGAQELQSLQEMLAHTEYWGYQMAGCPIGAALTLEYDDGSMRVMELATDSCAVFRLDGHDFFYARHIGTPGNHPDNSILFGLFGITAQ